MHIVNTINNEYLKEKLTEIHKDQENKKYLQGIFLNDYYLISLSSTQLYE